MRIAVINEISTCAKNAAVMAALRETEHEVFNVGMTEPSDRPELTYLHTALLSALVLEMDLADLVVGGCGTGQGYLNAVLQYPGITCALVTEPLDAWLAKRINAPNCISLALNKGYGWAGDVNLRLIVKELLAPSQEAGYPPERVESQSRSRQVLKEVSAVTHRPLLEILRKLDAEITGPVFACEAFRRLAENAADSELKAYVLAQ